jgi:hypothetical protein
MKLFNPWSLLLMAACWPALADAQVQLLPDRKPQRVFAGVSRNITIIWHNTGNVAERTEIRTRLYQTSSTTAVPLTEKPWKNIEILPGQTVLESASVDFPAINAETRFLIQWLGADNHVIGETEALVYPTNLMGELRLLLSGGILGVFDPNNELKPLFRQNKIEFLDLAETPLEGFQGKLAIIGPFQSKTQMREGLGQAVQRIARKGAAVVWIQPPPDPQSKIKPSFYVVQEGRNPVVVVGADCLANLAGNPQSQLNLVDFCKLALNPTPFPLLD